jgi:hypothetical protein
VAVWREAGAGNRVGPAFPVARDPAGGSEGQAAPSPALARSWGGLCSVGHPGFVALGHPVHCALKDGAKDRPMSMAICTLVVMAVIFGAEGN